jgi:hypothetical protein
MSIDDEDGVGVATSCTGVGMVKLDEEMVRSAGIMVLEEVWLMGVAIDVSVFTTRTLMGPELLLRCIQYLPLFYNREQRSEKREDLYTQYVLHTLEQVSPRFEVLLRMTYRTLRLPI